MVASIPRKNNLDCLRLAFAAQVMLVHTSTHLGLQLPRFILHFPGVPAFFFISGLLIYRAYIDDPVNYYRNRFLRIFPALFAVTLGGLGVLLLARGWRDIFENGSVYGVWFLAQLSLGQAYNPQLFRGVGVGVINGSLWTITTEILFYLSIPAVVRLEHHVRHIIPVLTIMSLAVYAFGPELLSQIVYRDKTAYDVLSLTPIPWGWMFGLGILSTAYFRQLQPWIRYFPLALIPMLAMMAFEGGSAFNTTGTRLGIPYFLAFIALVLWAGFETRIIRIPDISYGVYLWHMPVINLLLVIGHANGIAAIMLTFMFAVLSYLFVERPAFRLKAHIPKP